MSQNIKGCEGVVENMKHVLVIDESVPNDKRTEALAVYKAVMTGRCDVCSYLKQCEAGFESEEFPKDAACMQILRESRN